jgi:hypothetical protein
MKEEKGELKMKIEGTPVKDADEKIILHITKMDVRAGAKKNADSCAAAKALCREHQCEAAKVHMSRAYIKKGGKWIRFEVSPALRAEVLAFDRGGAFEPGEYILNPPRPVSRLGADKRPNSHRSGPDKRKNHMSKGKRKRPYHVATGVRARMVDQWWKEQPK